MEKIYKKIVVILSYILIIANTFMVFAAPIYIKSEHKIDVFSSASIAENIKNMEMNMTSVIYVENTKGEWEEYQRLHGNENRIWVGIDKMPENLKNAFVAIEDERFYKHSGVDWKRTVGAVGNYIFKFDDTEFGGSTITQQLIKNVTMDNGRNALRKFREIIRACLIEFKLDKTQILEAYLNTISLGNGICGVQVASNYYFNKEVADLTLTECAALAAITKNPSLYNPVTGMEENDKRRNTVLDKMLELEMIEKNEYDEAYNQKITLDDSQEDDLEIEINSYFVDTLIEQVIEDLSEKYNCSEDIASTMLYNGGFKIYSTVNPEIQNTMEEVYADTQKYFKLMGEDLSGEWVNIQSAMTIMDYEGHIVGIMGGVGEKTVNRGLNRAISSPRQPGSTMKPIGVYALAIENDIVHYSSNVLDQPIENYYPDGKKGPKEWYGYYKGDIKLNYAIRKSANTIPVRLLQEVGIEKSYDFLTNKLNCKYLTETDKNLAALALGGCSYGITTTESAAAYAIFGNQGVYHKPTTYYKIERVGGEVILDYDEKGEQVISPATATIMNHLLQEVVYGSEGTGGSIAGFNYSMRAYAKTGTSSESKDLWMVAGTPYYVGSVWCGFDKQQEINSTSAAATVWRDVMKAVHKGLEAKTFTDSEDVYRKGAGYYKVGSTPDNIIYSSSTDSSSTDSSQVSGAEGAGDVNSSAQNSGAAASNNTASQGSSSNTVTSAPSSGNNSSSSDNSATSKPSTSQKPQDSQSGEGSSSSGSDSGGGLEPGDSSTPGATSKPTDNSTPADGSNSSEASSGGQTSSGGSSSSRPTVSDNTSTESKDPVTSEGDAT